MKKVKAFLAAFLLATSSLFVLAAPRAFAATDSWDGGGSDNNMTTDANWLDNTAPVAGDLLVFPAGITDRTVVNDYPAATSFNSITFSGAASSDSDYTLSGASMTLVAGINNSMTGVASKFQTINLALILNGTQTFQAANGSVSVGAINLGSSALTITPSNDVYFFLSGSLSGSGNITKSGTGRLSLSVASASYSGTITANAGTIYAQDATALGSTAGGTVINDGADLVIGNCANLTVAENITLTGNSSNTDDDAKLQTGTGCSGAPVDEVYGFGSVDDEVVLSGNITLGSDVTFGALAQKTTLTGELSGDFNINILAGYGGDLVVDSSANTSKTKNGTYAAPTLDITVSDDLPTTTVLIQGKTAVTLTGKRGDTTVANLATLKGNGTAGIVTVDTGGTLAPGLSPGCLTLAGLNLSGNFDAELGGTTVCTGYDQAIVNGAVDLTDGTLNVSLYNNFKPKVGEKFVIINNDGTDAITGTFTDIAEGGTVTVSGYSFKVSYVGGSGNDVELTVLATPPATGFALVKSNPLVTAGLVIIAAFGILMIARRSNKLFVRR